MSGESTMADPTVQQAQGLLALDLNEILSEHADCTAQASILEGGGLSGEVSISVEEGRHGSDVAALAVSKVREGLDDRSWKVDRTDVSSYVRDGRCTVLVKLGRPKEGWPRVPE